MQVECISSKSSFPELPANKEIKPMHTLVNWAEKHLGTHNGWTCAHPLHVTFPGGGGGGLLPSHIFTTGLTIMGLHFSKSH